MAIYEINGQCVELDDRQVRELINRLVRTTQLRVWLQPKTRFDRHYQNWQYHNRGHDFNLFLLVVETVGGARLPEASLARRLLRNRSSR